MKKVILSMGTLLCMVMWASLSVQGQESQTKERDASNYSREFIWGASTNSNSGLVGGILARYSQVLSPGVYQVFGLEVVNVRHHLEFKRSSNAGGGPFIFGKQNYLLSARPLYARDWILFKKASMQGVQVNGQLGGGPSIGIQFPYMVDVVRDNGSIETVPFDPSMSLQQIVGSPGLLGGISNPSLKPGIHAKASLLFEFGTFKSNVTGFELGVTSELFFGDIVLVPAAENRQFYNAAYLAIFYGKRR